MEICAASNCVKFMDFFFFLMRLLLRARVLGELRIFEFLCTAVCIFQTKFFLCARSADKHNDDGLSFFRC